jgi:hypothetical protein
MRLFSFLVWLTTGALVGWLASKMVSAENMRRQKQAWALEDSD